MRWIRNTALVSLAIAVICWSLLGFHRLHERRAAAECRHRRLSLNVETMRCVDQAPAVRRFAKRHSWLVGATALSTTAAWSYGLWYLLYFRLPRKLAQRQVKRRRR